MITEFRTLVDYYQQKGELRHVYKQVRSRYELPAIMKKTNGGKPVMFHHVDDHAIPVAGGFGNTREAIAESMGVSVKDLRSHFAQAIAHPIPTHRVEQGPVQQHVVYPPFTLTDYFPIMTYYEKDSAPFMICGILTLKNMDGSKTYTSIRRMQYLGENKCNTTLTSRAMQKQLAWHRENKVPWEVAVMFGVVPAVFLASQISTQMVDTNKLDVTGALLGESLPVVKGKTVDIDVLANAELVLEGQMKPWITDLEGPFGEMCRYYGIQSPMPRIEFTALTYRDQPVFQTLFPSGYEETLYMALFREVMLYDTVKRIVPGVKQVHLTPGGIARYHAVIQMAKENEYQPRQAALCAFAADRDLKHVVVVDEDVDPFDPQQVEWAVATRFQADRDLFIVPDCEGSPLEPSHLVRGKTAKMALDATKPLGDPRFELTHIPGEEELRLEDYFADSSPEG